ncbi:hypothetical protein A2U01_0092794, partial [Trifolium medium]|nr:hypothetical protein [Trifolium medium]
MVAATTSGRTAAMTWLEKRRDIERT